MSSERPCKNCGSRRLPAAGKPWCEKCESHMDVGRKVSAARAAATSEQEALGAASTTAVEELGALVLDIIVVEE